MLPGLRGARTLASRWADSWFDRLHGTETARWVEPRDLDVVGPHRDRAVRYQPTRALPLRRLLRDLRLPAGEIFVDIGCGKGRALLVARDFGFRRLVGVEYAPSLCEIAGRNLQGAGPGVPCEIRCFDAAEYPFDRGETVIYLFNPFDAVVLAAMMERLAASLAREPRRAWLIYLFPRWYEVIQARGLFTLDALHVHGDCEFAVYVHDPAEHG